MSSHSVLEPGWSDNLQGPSRVLDQCQATECWSQDGVITFKGPLQKSLMDFTLEWTSTDIIWDEEHCKL